MKRRWHLRPALLQPWPMVRPLHCTHRCSLVLKWLVQRCAADAIGGVDASSEFSDSDSAEWSDSGSEASDSDSAHTSDGERAYDGAQGLGSLLPPPPPRTHVPTDVGLTAHWADPR